MTSPNNMASTGLSQQVVQIASVDPVGLTAVGYTRQKSTVNINLQYLVGSMHVIPCVGEQWVLKKVSANWGLERKLPKNDNTLANVADNPVQGLTQIGSSGVGSGPMILQGSVVITHAPLRLQSYATASRPDPATSGAGALIYDSTLNKIVFSDGTGWNVMT